MIETATSLPRINEVASKETLVHRLKPLINGFLDSVEYRTPPTPKTKAIYEAMARTAAQAGIPIDDSPMSESIFQVGVSVASDMYPHHPLDVQIYIGLYTWLATLIDDKHSPYKMDLNQFQARFSSGEKQSSPILENFAEVLRSTYKYYDPIIANFIIIAGLAFVCCNSLETRDEYQAMVPKKEAINWPYYFRDKEGLPEAYAYFCFPKDPYSDVSAYLPAIPEICKTINLTNDILSFYKEERAGESKNHINKRAFCEDASAISVLQSIIIEGINMYQRSRSILRDSDIYDKSWHDYFMGYVAFHVKNPYRYRLQELGLDDKYMV